MKRATCVTGKDAPGVPLCRSSGVRGHLLSPADGKHMLQSQRRGPMPEQLDRQVARPILLLPVNGSLSAASIERSAWAAIEQTAHRLQVL